MSQAIWTLNFYGPLGLNGGPTHLESIKVRISGMNYGFIYFFK